MAGRLDIEAQPILLIRGRNQIHQEVIYFFDGPVSQAPAAVFIGQAAQLTRPDASRSERDQL